MLSTVKARNRKLSKLNLENNRFTEIPTRAFRQAQTITSLKIGSNPLQSLDSWGFTTLNVLTELDIRNLTQLSVIKASDFLLLFFHIQVQDDAFKGISLRTLIFSNSYLKKVPNVNILEDLRLLGRLQLTCRTNTFRFIRK